MLAERNWVTTAFSRKVGDNPDNNFTILQQHFAAANGEPNHPYCITAALQVRQERPSLDPQPCRSGQNTDPQPPDQ